MRMRPMVEKLETVSGAITVLVDNTIMELVPDSAFVKRLSKPPANFLAEHGFSVLIETGNKKILVDTGATGIALQHNLALLGLSFDDIDLIFLSHGHYDHTGGLPAATGKVLTHHDAFCERFLVPNPGVSIDVSGPALRGDNHSLEYQKGPVKLAEGVITTGEIHRVHDWEELPIFRIKKNDVEELDRVWDDQAVVINSEHGLVIVAGCSHAGIINTIKHAMNITGLSKIYCVIGGFHLIGPGEAKIDRTIQELKKINIEKIVPIHCTGFEATKRLSTEMEKQFEYCTAGCRMEF